MRAALTPSPAACKPRAESTPFGRCDPSTQESDCDEVREVRDECACGSRPIGVGVMSADVRGRLLEQLVVTPGQPAGLVTRDPGWTGGADFADLAEHEIKQR